MLRRVKKDVEQEMAEKIELDLACEMTKRQKAMYAALRAKISIEDLMNSLKADEKTKALTYIPLIQTLTYIPLYKRRP